VALAAFFVCSFSSGSLRAQSPEGALNDTSAPSIPETVLGSTEGVSQNATVADATSAPPPPPAGFAALAFGGSSNAPDEITPEITALTLGVTNGPGSASAWQKCFLFVTNQLEYEHYYGCKKGALLTYIERKGNDADLASLLVAMLRSAGYSSARYGYGVVAYQTAGNPDGIHIQDWFGVPVAALSDFSFQRGFPNFWSDNASVRALNRVWVEVDVAGTTYRLDPAMKKRVRIAPSIDAAALSGYSRAALKSAAGGTIASTSIDGLDYNALSTYMTARASALATALDQNYHGIEAQNLLGGWRQEPFLLAGGSQLLFPGSVLNAQPGETPPIPAAQTFTALPAWLLTELKVEIKNSTTGAALITPYTLPTANLQGRRLSLAFTNTTSTGQAQLWLDDTLLAQESSAASGTTVTVKYTINHPHSNAISTTLHNQYSEKPYVRGSRHALTYSFNPTAELLWARQNQLDAYRRSGLSDTSREVVTETLNVIGLTWMHQTELFRRVLGGKSNCDPTMHHRMGRVSQENGYYIGVLCI
jgi:hypothetical protein